MAGTRILVGTTKGAFLVQAAPDRGQWQLSGPQCDGWPINHFASDPETGTLWAAGGNDMFGAGVWRSEDGGATWELSLLANGQFDEMLANDPEIAAYVGHGPAPDAPFKGQIAALWSLCLAGDTLYAGAKPAALFASKDRGITWARVQGLSDHPSGDSWQPGGAGLTLHTILADRADPAKLWVAISAAGVFASEDGGTSWERRNRLDNTSDAAHDHGPCGHEIGHCVHNMARAAGAGEVIYQQNHHGTFRSPDGGRSWQDITAGLPSNFGFPIAAHPTDPATAWVLPLNGDTQGRYPPNASAAVYKTSDAGATWAAKTKGLPVENCFFTVLRQAMAVDAATPTGLYFGTNSGSVFASLDEGESWAEIARHLPTVLCVEVVAEA
ncbi:exo-alpha-sialidase [Pseudorhodobacter sp. E13]|uniref:WD40/YVTN/BNR-like repeat-containing protein n=1 Tax=Pseudorhodobacter sp. E13 TaxID=2487931 RepID=UPI000F8F2CD1|nr:exo-alpha-sialidase [Pseudorhodobacter sp. E13]RUS58829.1 exo-alpha-sialidase [Pseudorhodobacter sp. E13]